MLCLGRVCSEYYCGYACYRCDFCGCADCFEWIIFGFVLCSYTDYLLINIVVMLIILVNVVAVQITLCGSYLEYYCYYAGGQKYWGYVGYSG